GRVTAGARHAGVRGGRRAPRGDAPGGGRDRSGPAGRRHHRDQAAAGALARRARPARLRPDTAPPDDPPRGGRGMTSLASKPEWAAVIDEHAVEGVTADRLVGPLLAVEVASLAFCRLLARWARGEADPTRPGPRQAARGRAADGVETALAGLERPLGRYLLELEADLAEGRSWFGEPSSAELVNWGPVLDRAGVKVAAHRVAAAYLELAVLVRALEGLSSQVRWQSSLDAGSLWAGLFDLRENLLGRAADDLRAIAA